MRIVITGGPGTGKSTIAKKLSEIMGIELVDIREIVVENRLYTNAEGEKEVDIKKLRSFLLPLLRKKKDYIVEGHLACEMRIPCDFVFVLRSNAAVLRKRMKKRKYLPKKIEENVLAELLDYCTQRVVLVYRKKPLELDTSGRKAADSAEMLAEAARKRKKKLDSVDYSGELKKYLGLIVYEGRKKPD